MNFSLDDNLFLTLILITSLLSLVLFVVLIAWLKVNELIKNQQKHVSMQEVMLSKYTLATEMNDKYQLHQQQQDTLNHQHIAQQQSELRTYFEQQMADLRIKLLRQMSEQKDNLTESLNKATQANREELSQSLLANAEQLSKRMNELTATTKQELTEISKQVEQRLAEGFDKTTKTFTDILKRLALIDDAQKKITELSTNVVSLQEVLADKRSRGAFGEVQLNALIRNVLPEQSFSLQHTLSNGKIADCILFLPSPTGNVVIDSKFPLESYRKMADNQLGNHDRKTAERQFKVDIKKHINDISDKYLIDNETADGAVMFIPAEAIFAEIHAHHSDLVDYANKKRVWLTSPTTLMAILTTARSVLKDEATRKQIHIIQAHLSELAVDFDRFKSRFANLAKHIDQAATDVKQIHTSADKITNRFEKIEQVDLVEEKQEIKKPTEEVTDIDRTNDNSVSLVN
ncbi:MAG: DNA recombination protein RmuC [Alteromonadaceae bacterium]|tara:strand:- start:2708 stop:4084 length:1377 start_codon:yes stop_codon:yes gene_type:complete